MVAKSEDNLEAHHDILMGFVLRDLQFYMYVL
jgi:hypothetical protein